MKKIKRIITAVVGICLASIFMFTGCSKTISELKNLADNNDSLIQNEALIDSIEFENEENGTVYEVPNEYEELFKQASDETATDKQSTTAEPSKEISVSEVFGFAIYETAYRLSQMSYDVYKGAAVVNEDTIVYGLMYTKYEYANGLPTCGFVELIEAGQTPVLNDEIIENGLVVVPSTEMQEQSFVVNRYVELPASSGVYGKHYFVSEQVANYAIQISVTESTSACMDETIDCYNYDAGRTMWLADPAPTISFEACSLYTADEAEAYNTAVEVVNQIVSLQNTQAYQSDEINLVIIETALLESIVAQEQAGAIGNENGLYGLEQINNIKLEDNQVVMITADQGVQVVTVPDPEELKAAADKRMAGGILQVIGGALMAIGSVALVVVTAGAAAPAVVAVSVVLGTVATTYAVSNIVEGAYNWYYGANGDLESVAINPVRDALANAINDENLANTLYHAIGLTSSLLQSLILPANSALNIAHWTQAGIGKTILIVVRAVGVELAKMAITAGVSYLASIGLDYVVTDITGSEAWGDVAGFGGALLAGFITYRGLTILDQKFNFSGLYTKVGLAKIYSDESMRKEMLSKFNEQQWKGMSLAQKKSAIQELANHIANDLGLDTVPRIEYYYNRNVNDCGYFYDGDYTLHINTYRLEKGYAPWVEIVDTVAHELRHAYQYLNLATNPESAVSVSYKNYISFNEKLGNYQEYRHQACEADAFNYGEYWAQLLKEIIY